MSPRAAWRLERLGFEEVYDYASGKQDWLAAGLPTEGRTASWPRAGTVAREDAPTCGLGERLGDVAERTAKAGWDVCVVANGDRPARVHPPAAPSRGMRLSRFRTA